jgi:tRNA (cmo5U34)-methyltransferase
VNGRATTARGENTPLQVPRGGVIAPDDPADVVTPIDGAYDTPSRVDELLGWLRDAGFGAALRWRRRDLAVLAADL